jgi:hydroxyacylglutathione hydrolase
MEIALIPALADNYIFLLYEPEQKIAAVVDPAQAEPVLEKLHELGLNLVAIFNTHHHGDHIGGNTKLKKLFPNLVVYAGAKEKGRIPNQSVYLEDGDLIRFCDVVAEVIFLPGHTRSHIAYYFPPEKPQQPGNLFCGDVLFAGGCGRIFEGTAAQMLESLDRLRHLPGDTKIWCAHEYTLKNLHFALTIEPGNLHLQNRLKLEEIKRMQDQPTIPSVLELELQTNPFLRWDQPTVQHVAGSDVPVKVLAKIRAMKDSF